MSLRGPEEAAEVPCFEGRGRGGTTRRSSLRCSFDCRSSFRDERRRGERIRRMTRTRQPPKSVFVLAFAECDELDVVGPTAVLQTANRYLNDTTRVPLGKPFTLRIVSVDGSGATCCSADGDTRWFVTGIHGITLGTESWDGAELPDILIVAGGNVEPGTGIMRQMKNPAFVDVIARQHARGMPVVSVCTGAFGLVGAGIAQGRRMTTHPGLLNRLAGEGVHVVNPD